MNTKSVDRLAWVLIYSGLGIVVVGLFVQPSSPLAGWLFVGVGAVDALVGAMLVVVRSRMNESADGAREP